MNPYIPTIGADPEAFIINTKTNKIVSAEGIVPGTKEKPYKVKRGAVQVDGILAEFNINPAQDRNTFSINIETVKNELRTIIKDSNPHLDLLFTPSIQFTFNDWKNFSEKELTIGCEPSFEVTHPLNTRETTLSYPKYTRHAGGHIHIGNIFADKIDTIEDKMLKCAALTWLCRDAKTFTNIIKQPNLVKHDLQYEKNGLYSQNLNKPLEFTSSRYSLVRPTFRLKEYGVELRICDNTWVKNPTRQKAIYQYILNNTIHFLKTWSYLDNETEIKSKFQRDTKITTTNDTIILNKVC